MELTIETGSWKFGSWKLDLVNFVHWFRKRLVDLGTEKAPGTKLAKSNFQLPTSNFLFLEFLRLPVRFSTSAKKALPRNADFICGNKKRTANPHKCTLSCGIGRDFHI